MIARVWHGWTTHQSADAYEQLLQAEILPAIEAEHGRGVNLLRRNAGEEVEFVTICYFENLDEVREFAGDDYEASVVPEKARRVLKRYDRRSQHYEIRREP